VDSKLKLLEEKLGQLMVLTEQLKSENKVLKAENAGIKAELNGLQQELSRLKLQQNDQTEAIRTKLNSLLSHVRELEEAHL